MKEVKDYLINPTIPIPKEASDIHGITDEMVADSPTFDKFAKNLNKYFEGCDLGGYNSNNFDIPLLIEEFSRSGIIFDTLDRNYIDVMKLEIQLNPRTLSAVYERYIGKPLEDAHDASVDVNATIDILIKQIDNHKLPTNMEEIDKLSQGENERVDIAGKLCKIDGEICWTFGKWKDKPITTDYGYIRWFLGTSVPQETARIIRENS